MVVREAGGLAAGVRFPTARLIRRGVANKLFCSRGDENGGAMFGEYSTSRTASRWLARAVGRRREAKPIPHGPTTEVYKVE